MSAVTIYDLIVDREWGIKLRKRRSIVYGEEELKVTSKEIAVEVIRKAFEVDSLTEEYMFLLCTDAAGKVKGLFEVSHGTVNGMMVNLSGIFKRALLCNAVNIILLHNHPSGDCSPSRLDREVYKKVKKAGELMEIELLDFIIIGKEYYSFKKAEDRE